MNRVGILEKLKKIFKLVIHNGVDVDSVSLDSNIMLDLGVNSVGLIYMMVAIENEFKIDMGDVTFNTFKTVNDVIDYIEKKSK